MPAVFPLGLVHLLQVCWFACVRAQSHSRSFRSLSLARSLSRALSRMVTHMARHALSRLDASGALLCAHHVSLQIWMLTSYVVDGFADVGTMLGGQFLGGGWLAAVAYRALGARCRPCHRLLSHAYCLEYDKGCSVAGSVAGWLLGGLACCM